ncbi:hypothetical protein B0H13DRAFT_1936098 [Mycena leptocephala]|nr:hypothetical protein B0H13DRAFT_1936098 [Mycena leptocephala]
MRIKDDGGIPGLEVLVCQTSRPDGHLSWPVSGYYHKRLGKGNLHRYDLREKVDLGGDSVLSSTSVQGRTVELPQMLHKERSLNGGFDAFGLVHGLVTETYREHGGKFLRQRRNLRATRGRAVVEGRRLAGRVAGLRGGFIVSVVRVFGFRLRFFARSVEDASAVTVAVLTPLVVVSPAGRPRLVDLDCAQVSSRPVAVSARCLSSNWKSAWRAGACDAEKCRSERVRGRAVLGAKSYDVGESEEADGTAPAGGGGGSRIRGVGGAVRGGGGRGAPSRGRSNRVNLGQQTVTWSSRTGRAIEGSGAAWKLRWCGSTTLSVSVAVIVASATKPKCEIFTQEV